VSNEAARGADIVRDAATGGAAGGLVGGLLGYGVADQVLKDIQHGGDSLLRRVAGNPRLRKGVAIGAATLAGTAGLAAGFGLAGGSRWMFGRPREKTSSPSGQKVYPMSRALGFAKEASLTEYGRKKSEGKARNSAAWVEETDKNVPRSRQGFFDRMTTNAMSGDAKREAWKSEQKGVSNLKRLNPWAGRGDSGQAALDRVRSKAASKTRGEQAGEFGANSRYFEGERKLHQRLGKEHPVQYALRDLGEKRQNRISRNVSASISNTRAAGKGGGRLKALFTGGDRDYAEFAKRDKAAAEHEAGFEQASGDLDTGAPLATGVAAMVRADVATDSAEVAAGQSAFQRMHGSAAGWEGGRP
jgi:hypothetical protein